MENVMTNAGMELLFEENVRLTDFIEYGFSMRDLVEGISQQVLGVGHVDFTTGQAEVKGFSI